MQRTATPINQRHCLFKLVLILRNHRQWQLATDFFAVGTSPYSLHPQWRRYNRCPQKKPEVGCTSSSHASVETQRATCNLTNPKRPTHPAPDQSHVASSPCSWPVLCGHITLLMTSQLLTTLCYLKAEKGNGYLPFVVRCLLWASVYVSHLHLLAPLLPAWWSKRRSWEMPVLM